MPLDRVEDLLQQCVAAREAGVSFPDVWDQIIKRHSLIAGPLTQRHENGAPYLEVRLVDGARLVCREDGYSIE